MESRALRFVDTNKAHSKDKRAYNEPNLHTGRRVPKPFHQVLFLLKEERHKNKLYDHVWKQAEKNFLYKKQTLGPNYFMPNIAKECYIAVIAYTMGLVNVSVDGKNRQLYEDFNKKFRNLEGKSSWQHFPYKSFYYLLKSARHGIANQANPKGRLFRGIRDVHLSPKPKIGDNFYFHCFSSCSEDYGTAVGFMGKNGTMIILEDGAELAMNIAPYSAFDDYEVLVFPHNKFKIVSFEKHGDIDKVVIKRAGCKKHHGGADITAQMGQLAICPQPSTSYQMCTPQMCVCPPVPFQNGCYLQDPCGQTWWCP